MKKILFTFLSLLVFYNFSFSQGKNDTTLARQYYTQALDLFEKADYDASIAKLEEAQKIYRKASNARMCVDCRTKSAQNLIRKGLADEALQMTGAAIREDLAKIPPNNVQEAGLYNVIGEAYLNKGRNDLALEYFQRALQIYNTYHKKNLKEAASCYNNIGLVYWNTGNRDLALEHQQKALDIRQKLYGENNAEVAASNNDLGLIYMQSEPDKANEYYQKALSIYQTIYEPKHPKLAVAYNNIAIVYRSQKKYEEALANLDKVLEIWLAVNGENHPNTAFTYSNIGQVYVEKEDFLSAMEYQKKALDIYKKNYGNKHPEVANTYNFIGSIYSRQQKYGQALENFQEAICANIPDFNNKNALVNPPINKYSNADLLLSSLLLKAQTFEEQHFGKTLKLTDLKMSLKTLEICDTLIENIRQRRTNKSDKIALGIVASEVYEDAIRTCSAISEVVLKKNEYLEKAFYFAEKSKSSVLLSAISDTEAKQFANIPADLLEKEKQFKSDIAFYEQKIAEGADPKQETILREKLFELNRQYDNFTKELEKKFADYYNLKYNVAVVTAADIQQILDRQSMILSYFIADKTNRIYIFSISKQEFDMWDVPREANLDKYITGIRNALRFKSSKIFINTARNLYKQLFPKSLGKDIQKLIIIPDGRLASLPFEALLSEKTDENNTDYAKLPYLVLKYAFSYNFSATLYYQTIKKSVLQDDAPKDIFLCAPVSFTKHDLNNLPATETEVTEINSLFTKLSKQAKTLLFAEAKEELIKSGELKDYQHLHFATHGAVNEESPELSQIFLSKESDTKSKEDGSLYSGEIYNLELNANLVTLSACETGLGKVAKGEGIIGLSRALLYAGAKNLMLSLWTVADLSTSQLMIQFYGNLLANTTSSRYVKALQGAKLKMIQQSQYASPYYWAPFVLIGM